MCTQTGRSRRVFQKIWGSSHLCRTDGNISLWHTTGGVVGQRQLSQQVLASCNPDTRTVVNSLDLWTCLASSACSYSMLQDRWLQSCKTRMFCTLCCRLLPNICVKLWTHLQLKHHHEVITHTNWYRRLPDRRISYLPSGTSCIHALWNHAADPLCMACWPACVCVRLQNKYMIIVLQSIVAFNGAYAAFTIFSVALSVRQVRLLYSCKWHGMLPLLVTKYSLQLWPNTFGMTASFIR